MPRRRAISRTREMPIACPRRADATLYDFSKRRAHRDEPVELMVEVLRRPVAAPDGHEQRRIVELARERDRGRAVRRLEARGVDERLEHAARRAARLGAAVELARRVIAPADEREHLAGLRPQRHEARFEALPDSSARATGCPSRAARAPRAPRARRRAGAADRASSRSAGPRPRGSPPRSNREARGAARRGRSARRADPA